jgi:hypothetical protein
MRHPILIALLAVLTAGCQVYNSGSRNKLLYGGGVDPGTSFGRAFLVIRERCLSCHAQFAGWTTEQAWIDNGYVVAGSIAESQVYNRLSGANLGISAEDMPLDSVLTSDELAAIREWIEGL